MKSVILLELAKRWEQDAQPPKTSAFAPAPIDEAINSVINRAHASARSETLRECADALKSLVALLGEK